MFQVLVQFTDGQWGCGKFIDREDRAREEYAEEVVWIPDEFKRVQLWRSGMMIAETVKE